MVFLAPARGRRAGGCSGGAHPSLTTACLADIVGRDSAACTGRRGIGGARRYPALLGGCRIHEGFQGEQQSIAEKGGLYSPVVADHPLTLDVTDCGPLARGCVELRPLTVFVGPSNTGKSWLATLVYALQRYLWDSRRGRIYSFRLAFEQPALPEGVRADLVRIAEQLAASASGHAELAAEGIELTAPMEAAIRLHIEEQGGELGGEIERCFGVDAGSQLIRKGGAGRARIRLRHAVAGVGKPAVHELAFGDERWTLQSAVPGGFRVRSDRHHHRRWFAELSFAPRESKSVEPHWMRDAIAALAEDMLPSFHPAFYLPADRTGLMNAHSTVVTALIQSATMAGIRRADPVPLLSGVRGDFLQQMVEMVSDRKQRSRRGREHLRRLGKGIEDVILGGAVKVGGLPGVAYPHFTYHPRGWGSGLSLTHASSMVSELAPVVLYLRHVIAPDDLLIIDEPESHLHPAMQVAFTRQIAAIVGAGVRVILTTHSEWVLEELGNVVGRSGSPDRGEGDSGNGSLPAPSVGVWLFEPSEDNRGSTVREIALDTDTGLYPSGFDAVAAALHNDWTRIADPPGDAG